MMIKLANTFFLMTNILIVLFIFINTNQNFDSSLILSISFFLICILLIRSNLTEKKNVFLQVSLLYYLYALILPGIYQSRTYNFFWPSTNIKENEIFLSSIIVFVFSVGIIFSFLFRINVKKGKNHDISHKNLLYLFYLFLLILILIFFYTIDRYGNIIFFGSRTEIELFFLGLDSNLSQIDVFLSRMIPNVLALISISVGLYLSKHVNFFTRFFIFTAILLTIIVFLNPYNTPRYFLISLIFIIFFVLFTKTFAKFWNYFIFVIPISIFTIFPIMGTWNRGLDRSFKFVDFYEFLRHGDLDGFQSIINAVRLVEIEGISWGNNIISSILFFIPRNVWSGKSELSGKIAAELSGYNFTNISMPLPGEIYISFGIIGVFALSAVFNLLLRYCDKLFFDNKNFNFYVVPASVLVGLLPFFLRGSLLSTIQALALSGGLFVFVIWLSSKRRKF